MVVIGVTGGVATGKSTVARLFRRRGAVVLDADAIAHELMRPRRVAWRAIRRAFGKGVLGVDGRVNRRRLAAVVFRHAARRRRLEGILHPLVYRRIRRDVARLCRRRGVPAVVLDVPLLFETRGQRLADVVVVVTAPRAVQRARWARHPGGTQEALDARMRAQWKLSAKAALADYVVDNANGLDATRTQVGQIWKAVVPPRPGHRPSSTSRR